MDSFTEIIDELNKNPDRIAIKLTTKQLEDSIEAANILYYNGISTLKDYAYDTLVYYLQKKYKAKNKRLERIGAIPNEKIRSKLPEYMPSLNKIKVHNLLNHLEKDLVWSLKLDGVSGMVIYKDGEVDKVFLRGDGIIGGDISFIKSKIKFPKITTTQYKNITIRGEFIMSKEDFEQYSTTYSNPRNFVSGALNSLYESDLSHISYVAFDIVSLGSEIIPKPLNTFKILESLDFSVVKYGIFEDPTAFDIIQLYKTEYEEYKYNIDGIVLSKNQTRNVPQSLHNPEDTVAFKMNLIEQIRDSKILNISWQISRHGRIIPVAEFEPVFIEGVRIHRATAHNAYTSVKKWKLGVGTPIKVTRSGGVIPQIVEVLTDENIEPIMPNIKYTWMWKGRDILLEDPESCPEVHIKRQIYFFETLTIPGIRDGMIRRMWENKLDKLEDIIKADPVRFKKVRGIGAKKSEKFVKDIKFGISHARMYRLMMASCCFEKGMGKTFMRLISTEIPDAICSDNIEELKKKLIKLKGIGAKRSIMFTSGLGKFKEFITNFNEINNNNIERINIIKQQGYNKDIIEKNFVFTNLDDDDLEDYIMDHKGSIGKSVTKKTNAVICGNLLSFTTKMEKAIELGIKIYTKDEFILKYNIENVK